MHKVRQFVVPPWHPRIVERKTYVFILVPFDFKNGHAKKADVAQHVLANHIDDDRELNSDLTWTWFLPNSLPLPKKGN